MTAKNPAGRPSADTLTDRYVWAVLKSLPEAKRADIDRELRATIADDVEAREADGRDAAAAEREALAELGDPARLAAVCRCGQCRRQRPRWSKIFFCYRL